MRCQFSVLLLYDVDPGWTRAEQRETHRDAAVLATALTASGCVAQPVPVAAGDLRAVLRPFDPGRYLVLNWCEDLPGEFAGEARAARIIEESGFLCTGSPPAALELSADKLRVKQQLQALGIPTPRGCLASRSRSAAGLRYPLIVKAAREHGSAGLSPTSVALNRRSLARRLARSAAPLLVEEFIDGREFHVSLWGHGRLQMLPPIEIDFQECGDLRERIYAYDSKYRSRSRHYRRVRVRAPAELTAAETRRLARTARAACAAVGCRDYARVDLRLRAGVFQVLDVNPNPDISPVSALACAAAQAGYDYGAMAARLVAIAWRRQAAGSQPWTAAASS